MAGSLGPTGGLVTCVSCPKSIPTKRLAIVSTSVLGGGSPSTSENRPTSSDAVVPKPGGAVGQDGVEVGVGDGMTVSTGVVVAVGVIPCPMAGAFKLNEPSRAINRMTVSNENVAIRHLAVKGKLNRNPDIRLRNLRCACRHL